MALLMTVALCVITVIGDYFLKLASGQSSPLHSKWFAVGIVLYTATAFGWVYVMRQTNLSTLGAVYSVSTIVLLTFVGVVFFREALHWQEGVGVAMAVASIVLLGRFA